MKTFHQFLLERDEKRHLRNVLIGNMGLDDTLEAGEGEEVMLTQLDLEEVHKKLTGSDLWDRLDPKVQKKAEEMFRTPGNSQLRDLLDVLAEGDIDLGNAVSQDDDPSPQITPTAAPPPST